MEAEERRIDERLKLIYSTEWQLEGDRVCHDGGDLVNLSKTGACLSLPGNHSVEYGEEFKFTLNYEDLNILNINGEVTWIRHSTITNNLYIGIKFDKPIKNFDERCRIFAMPTKKSEVA